MRKEDEMAGGGRRERGAREGRIWRRGNGRVKRYGKAMKLYDLVG